MCSRSREVRPCHGRRAEGADHARQRRPAGRDVGFPDASCPSDARLIDDGDAKPGIFCTGTRSRRGISEADDEIDRTPLGGSWRGSGRATSLGIRSAAGLRCRVARPDGPHPRTTPTARQGHLLRTPHLLQPDPRDRSGPGHLPEATDQSKSALLARRTQAGAGCRRSTRHPSPSGRSSGGISEWGRPPLPARTRSRPPSGSQPSKQPRHSSRRMRCLRASQPRSSCSLSPVCSDRPRARTSPRGSGQWRAVRVGQPQLRRRVHRPSGVLPPGPTIRGCERARRERSIPSRIPVGECIHPRRARPFAYPLRSIRCGIFAGYPAFESPFNERIDSGLLP